MASALYRAVLATVCLGSVSTAAVGQAPSSFPLNATSQALPADAAQLPAAAANASAAAPPPTTPATPATPMTPTTNAATPIVPNMTVVKFPSSDDVLPNVDATVTQRISRDSDRIGSIAKKLLNVQQAISKVETEALDKVFDMHSIKSFLNEHQSAVDREKHLDQEIASVAAQEKALTGKLTQVNVNMDEQQADHDTRVQKLKLKLAEGKSKIQQLQMQMERTRMIQKEIKMLPAVNEELVTKNVKAAAEKARLDEELKAEQQKENELKEAVKMVGMQLQVQVAYKEKCTAKLSKVQQAISAVKAKKATEKSRIQEKLKSASDAQQGLLKDNDILKQRLRKAEANKATIKNQIAATRANIAALQKKGKEAVEVMQTRLATSQQEGARVGAQLAATIANLDLIHSDIASIEKENYQMGKRINDEAGQLKALRSKRMQLQLNLSRTETDEMRAKASIAKAEERAAKSKAKVKAMRKQAEASADFHKISEAKRLLVRVAAAKRREKELNAKVEAATKHAHSPLVKKSCMDAWDKNHTEVRELLESCDKVAEELQSTRKKVDELRLSQVQVVSLRQSLSARNVQGPFVQDADAQGADQQIEDSADQD